MTDSVDTRVYIVNGLGCAPQTREDDNQERNYYNDVKTSVNGTGEISHYRTFCYGTTSAIINIISQFSGTGLTPMRGMRKKQHKRRGDQEDNKTLYEIIFDDLQEGRKVCLYGHSFGGLIVNRLCEKLVERIKDLEILGNLYVATFGSIYISDKLDGINIKQYMFVNDVALKQNRLIEPDYNSRTRSKSKTSNSRTRSKSKTTNSRTRSKSKTRSRVASIIHNSGISKMMKPFTRKSTKNKFIWKPVIQKGALIPDSVPIYNNLKYSAETRTKSKIIWLKYNAEGLKLILSNKALDPNEEYKKLFGKKGVLIGSGEEWKLHNLYFPLMMMLIVFETNDIADIKKDKAETKNDKAEIENDMA